ncbi:MAG TPA: sugar ABC transporter ATP-binding protein [Ktedonobacteraceae bacterium]|nr:sugar ABC transporter ATP-binding protein [Ktedonobacteraceae bacterium]
MGSIEGIGIFKSFGGVRALQNASFSAEPAEVHALVGENGAGKSTMIKILSGLFHPDSGKLRVQGREVVLSDPQDALRLNIGTVFQELTLFPYMTVAENLLMGREPRNFGFIDRAATIATAWKLLHEIGISGIEPLELVANLSLGQRQIVEIVKVISRRPQILFMDEPTSALTEREVEWLFGVIRKLREQNTCIVFTSHRWNEIVGIADRITIFRNGENVGTYEATVLNEQDAVERMTGRKLDRLYPVPITLLEKTPKLQVSDLSGTNLHEVSFTAHRGEVLGIGGLAGQGQRELLLTLFGVRRASSGTLAIEGKNIHISNPHEAIRKGIALLPEDRKTEGLLLPLPVRQNLTLPILGQLSYRGFIRRDRESNLVRTMIDRLAIRTPGMNQPVGSLSGGNQQKVLIGRWLLTQATIFLLYDVTRGVDVATKHEIYELIKQMSQEGRTVLFYSTDTEEMAHVCHRVLVMYEGRIVDEITGPDIVPEAIVAAALHGALHTNVEVPG